MAESNVTKYIINQKYEIESSTVQEGKILYRDGSKIKFLFKERIYNVTILNHDVESKTYKLKINGFTAEIKKLTELDEMIQQLGYNTSLKTAIKEIVAPMPGLVKSIFIKEGDVITSGQNLFILEAMKMENIIKSSGEGTVMKINVAEGDKVEKGKILAKL
jgi:biotin carboxyl carrier protein